ncbi:hypothetical protein AA0113_g308 [Alternaria arborescens]|uniref:Uncharacterized protein n=1 Tax=Alternaria arborescens TaxID=156630 RepID=A0A4Q4SRQ3_9PLEO|nr:hypothetical protein AA0111_g7564 [Alternaria arborescens]RYO27097.1 hypothetical protein AA0111_g7564 [Alternaria arborescens]RYO73291.1 hypothetical protein AA0113_g308 [Alternaria arborescens]
MRRHPELCDTTAAQLHILILDMSVWQWFKGIPPKTRMIIGVGVMAYAGAGLYISDRAEEKFGLVPTDKDREELRDALPKITPVEK